MSMNGLGGMRRPPPQQQRRPPVAGEIQDRARVMVRGLSSRPELNGGVGSVADYDRAKGRYIIAVGNGEAVALKPQNLLQVLTQCIVSSPSSVNAHVQHLLSIPPRMHS